MRSDSKRRPGPAKHAVAPKGGTFAELLAARRARAPSGVDQDMVFLAYLIEKTMSDLPRAKGKKATRTRSATACTALYCPTGTPKRKK